jgi:DNA uptake protein ComE-like DNA-binding protein
MHTPQKALLGSHPLPQLTLQNAGYRIESDRVHITCDRIENNRNQSSLSGTLSVEFWALSKPYSGGAFAGTPLAGTQIGQLMDNAYLEGCHYDLCFAMPPAGEWSLCLMLREWDGQIFNTIDYVNFSLPLVVEPSDQPAPKTDLQNVIEVDFGGRQDKEALPELKRVQGSKPNERQPSELTQIPAKKTEKKSAEAPVNPSPSISSKKPLKTKVSSVNRTPVKGSELKVINLNTASLKEVEAIKGVSKTLAKQIVDERPIASVDKLLSLKGMGPKLLEKIKPQISL